MSCNKIKGLLDCKNESRSFVALMFEKSYNFGITIAKKPLPQSFSIILL